MTFNRKLFIVCMGFLSVIYLSAQETAKQTAPPQAPAQKISRFGQYVGVSRDVTEGELRASHKSIQQPPYDNLSLPYHRSYDTDVAGLKPGEPVELVFDLEPTSNAFDAGNRIRLTITGADKDNAATPVLNPAPTVTIYRDAAHASFISLPLIGEEKVIESERSSKLAIGFIVAVIIILVIAFTFYVRSRLAKK